MRSGVIGLAAGVVFLQSQAALPAPQVLFLLAVLAILLLLYARRPRWQHMRMPLLVSGGAALGFAWAGMFAHHYLAQELPVEWEGRDITVVGVIDSLPYRFDRGVRFDFTVEKAVDDDGRLAPIPGRLALSWYSSFRSRGNDDVPALQPGERWQMTVRLRRPHGNANPDGFDYEVWLLEQNLRATGYVRPDGRTARHNVRLNEFVPGFGVVVERCRGWLRERIFAALPDKKYAGVIVALVIGDQRAVSQSDWNVFNRSGISHLVSISGLHITMISGLFAAAVLGLWRRSFFTSANLPLRLPAQKAAALAGAIAALLYVLLAGFGVPAQRTLAMLTVVAAALWCGRITSVSHVLCAALGIVLLIDPWAVLWPGFWLSFGAVACILFASTGRSAEDAAPAQSGWRSTLKSAAHTQYAVTVGLVPLTMLLFGQVSLVSPLANAIAIPLVSFIVTPLSLAGSVLPLPLAKWVLGLAHFFVEWLARFLEWLSAGPAAVWTAPIPPWWVFIFALIGILWLLAPRGWPVRWMGIAGLLPLFVNSPAHPKDGEMWVTAFDIGQGMALLIETSQRRLLYDTGPSFSAESDAGDRVIVPYLKARGIGKLDGMIISHSDTDHSGGALSVLDAVAVDWVASSLAEDNPIVAAAPHHRRCEAGQAWVWDAARFEMLNPAAVSYDSAKWKPNARSCALKVTIGAQSILLPGDIEAIQEDELVGLYAEKLRSSVLIAPHHGSGTSSTLPFLRAVQPKLALFQVGYRNRYHHPKKEVFERYGQLGIRRVRTDEGGAVSLIFGERFEMTEYREVHARYWYGR